MKSVFQHMINFWEKIRYFFPIHLVLSQFKHNIVVLFYWLFLFLIINEKAGVGIGLPYLFLSPEYHGNIGFMSFLLLGFSTGGFMMAFHAYSYIHLGSKYPFIATLERPFFKFCVNNSVIPIVFTINFSYNIISFQRSQEFVSLVDAWLLILALLIGLVLFIAFSFLYFFPTNKDFFKLSGRNREKSEKKSNMDSQTHRKTEWFDDFQNATDHKYFYIGKGFRWKQSRSCRHYDIQILQRVFAQNHTNASFFEIALVISFILIGFFKDFEAFQVPASVSIMMLLTIVIMVISALFSWLNRWAYPVIILVIFGLNLLSTKTDSFKFQSEATGLSYEKEDLVPFTPERVREIGFNQEQIEKDRLSYFETLENWKANQIQKKPKLILVNTSGGGLRSSLWTFSVLQYLDSISNNEIGNNIQMIAGASGGMVGAAYYRELILKTHTDIINRTAIKYRENIGKDLLNRISFSVSTNDIFFRFQKAEYNGKLYTKDRGYAFEQGLNDNLDSALNKSLGAYYSPEKNGKVPTMIFTPTIINDGRRLVIGAQQLSFLNEMVIKSSLYGLHAEMENVEYLKYFKEANPEELFFPTVLRMNATFPYILPMVTLPTVPGMQIMDAGIRDNYGTKITVQYLAGLEEWIKENTSGVVIIKIRDTKKNLLAETYDEIGLISKLLLPLGNLYGNFPRVQDFDQDELLMTWQKHSNFPLDVVTFNLREKIDDKIALSWHLTKQEKKKIISAIHSLNNQLELDRLMELLQIELEN